MEDRTHLVRMAGIDRERVFEGCVPRFVTCMDDDIQSAARGQFEMLFKKPALKISEPVLIPTIRCRVKIIETGFPQRANTWIGEVGSNDIHHVPGRVMHVARVNAEAGMNSWIARVVQIRGEVLKACRQSDQTADTSLSGGLDQ